MESESLLNLFDSYWFEHGILKNQAHPPNSEPNQPTKTLEIPNPNMPAISTRSMDELVSSTSNGSSISSFSPNSVLLPRTLQPIFSGKVMKEPVSEQEEEELQVSRTVKKPKSCSGEQRRTKNRGISQGKKSRKLKKGASKSLSDLEFEEIKGFMELGFVFSEEDKSSEFLATILPGLQRLGVEDEVEKEGFLREIEEGSGISRPYLSEAWVRRRENPPLTMSWEELPPVKSKIDMKDYLKDWAHTVASSVK